MIMFSKISTCSVDGEFDITHVRVIFSKRLVTLFAQHPLLVTDLLRRDSVWGDGCEQADGRLVDINFNCDLSSSSWEPSCRTHDENMMHMWGVIKSLEHLWGVYVFALWRVNYCCFTETWHNMASAIWMITAIITSLIGDVVPIMARANDASALVDAALISDVVDDHIAPSLYSATLHIAANTDLHNLGNDCRVVDINANKVPRNNGELDAIHLEPVYILLEPPLLHGMKLLRAMGNLAGIVCCNVDLFDGNLPQETDRHCCGYDYDGSQITPVISNTTSLILRHIFTHVIGFHNCALYRIVVGRFIDDVSEGVSVTNTDAYESSSNVSSYLIQVGRSCDIYSLSFYTRYQLIQYDSTYYRCLTMVYHADVIKTFFDTSPCPWDIAHSSTFYVHPHQIRSDLIKCIIRLSNDQCVDLSVNGSFVDGTSSRSAEWGESCWCDDVINEHDAHAHDISDGFSFLFHSVDSDITKYSTNVRSWVIQVDQSSVGIDVYSQCSYNECHLITSGIIYQIYLPTIHRVFRQVVECWGKHVSNGRTILDHHPIVDMKSFDDVNHSTSRQCVKSFVFDTDLPSDLNGDMLMSHHVVRYSAQRPSLLAELDYRRILCSVFMAESTDIVPSSIERRYFYEKPVSVDRTHNVHATSYRQLISSHAQTYRRTSRPCSRLRTHSRRSRQYSHLKTCVRTSRQNSRLDLSSDIPDPTIKLYFTSKISSIYVRLTTWINTQDFVKNLNSLIEWGATVGSKFVEQSLVLYQLLASRGVSLSSNNCVEYVALSYKYLSMGTDIM
jgi:hypothetical protein